MGGGRETAAKQRNHFGIYGVSPSIKMRFYLSKEKQMKRIGLIMLGIAVFAIVFAITLAVVSIPVSGRVFSRVNPTLNDSYYSEEMPGVGGGAPVMEVPVAAPAATQSLAFDNSQSSERRLVIKNADLTIVVKDPVTKMDAIASMAESMGGFVVSTTTGESYLSDGTTKVPEGSIMVRIPAEKLNDALKEIKSDAVDVQNETQSGQDVTKEYTDLDSQLKNLNATEAKLTEIMEKAEATDDVLAVFNQLTQIRGQIEVIKGQMQYYEQSVALSAVSVRLIADKAIQPIEIAGWQPQGEARDAVQALVNFFQNFVTFLIWLVIFFIPIAAIIIVLIALLWRFGNGCGRKPRRKSPRPLDSLPLTPARKVDLKPVMKSGLNLWFVLITGFALTSGLFAAFAAIPSFVPCADPTAQRLGLALFFGMGFQLLAGARRWADGRFRWALAAQAALLLLTVWLGLYPLSPLFSSGRIPVLRGFSVLTRTRGTVSVAPGGTVTLGSGIPAAVQALTLVEGNIRCRWMSTRGGALDDPQSCTTVYVPPQTDYDILKLSLQPGCGLPRFALLPSEERAVSPECRFLPGTPQRMLRRGWMRTAATDLFPRRGIAA